MEIKILGSGSAYGSPICFNTWGDITNINNPKNIRTRPSILISDQGKNILVDMGPDFRTQINQNNITNIDALFLTHGHYDHVGGVPELWRVSSILRKHIPVFASQETLDEINKIFYYMFKANNESVNGSIEWNHIQLNNKFEVCGLEFTAFGVPHHNLTTTCFKYKNFAYVPDLQNLTDEAKQHMQNLDLLIIECNNGLKKLNNGHSDFEQVMAWIDELKPKNAILSHLSVKVDYEELSKLIPDNVSLAFDGMTIQI